MIGTIVSARLATLQELQTAYGPQAMYDLLEIITVDAYNRELIRKHNSR